MCQSYLKSDFLACHGLLDLAVHHRVVYSEAAEYRERLFNMHTNIEKMKSTMFYNVASDVALLLFKADYDSSDKVMN